MGGGYTIGDMPEHDPSRYAFEQSCDDEPWRVAPPAIEDSGREVELTCSWNCWERQGTRCGAPTCPGNTINDRAGHLPNGDGPAATVSSLHAIGDTP